MNPESRQSQSGRNCHSVTLLAIMVLSLAPGVDAATSRVWDNLERFNPRFNLGDPTLPAGTGDDGPKDLAAADFDGDGLADVAASNKDGTVTVRFGLGDGILGEPLHLRTFNGQPLDAGGLNFPRWRTNITCNWIWTNTIPGGPEQWLCSGVYVTNIFNDAVIIAGATGLRGIVSADFNDDGNPDLAVAAPGEARVHVFLFTGNRSFAGPLSHPAWLGARDLAAGDFDGDGVTDLAVAGGTNGVSHWRSLGNGTFAVVTNHPSLGTRSPNEFPRPAFYLRSFRPAGATRDELVVARAQRDDVSVLASDSAGRLAVRGGVTNVPVNAFDVGPLLHTAWSGVSDLVVAHNDNGTLEIHSSESSANRFNQITNQLIRIPGGPRNVRIVDLDGDGWNDLVVVQQHLGRVLTYRNLAGVFVAASDAAVGSGPREMDLGDFNGDGFPDVAVLNRDSRDVSILQTYVGSVGFSTPESTYPNDGSVSGLEVRDFDGDGRADVLQLLSQTGELSVRYSNPDGSLREPVYIQTGFRPSGTVVVDVNHDGRPDIVTAGMSPSITVRLGLPDRMFGPPQSFVATGGAVFLVDAADLDSDGHVDLVVGFWDCRVGFYRGHGDGSFTFTRDSQMFPEPRAVSTGDFDGDGDIDVAMSSYYGLFGIIENRGALLGTQPLTPAITSGAPFGGTGLIPVDHNHDGDPDLLAVGSHGTTLFLGGAGLRFQGVTNAATLLGSVASTAATGDFNADGSPEVATGCAELNCVTLASPGPDGKWTVHLRAGVPGCRMLAAGDLDGDDLPDLVGSGEVLWVALSSRISGWGSPHALPGSRGITDRPVINEIMASADTIALPSDGGRSVDWVELFNGMPGNQDLTGWRLNLYRTNITVTVVADGLSQTNVDVERQSFPFPPGTVISNNSHLVVIFSENRRSPLHTGFNLPATGGALCLVDGAGTDQDVVAFGAQTTDIAYGRFRDGMTAFGSTRFPTPGAANTDSGPIPPTLEFLGVDLNTLKPFEPIRFFARATDDIAVLGVSVRWRRLDGADATIRRVVLTDDGLSGDGALLDGLYSGVLFPGLPAGAEIEFVVEAVDIDEQTVTRPGGTDFGPRGQPTSLHTLAVGVPVPRLEFSEIVADNATGRQDEAGGTPDWIEIRNGGTTPVQLGNVTVGRDFFGNGSRLALGALPSLAPGDHRLLFADGQPDQGPTHAPFQLDRGGDQLVMTGLGPNGGRTLIDWVKFGEQATDVALARIGFGGPWRANTPTPAAGNVTGRWQQVTTADRVVFGFPTQRGTIYVVESTDDPVGGAWIASPPIAGDGLEHTVEFAGETHHFFRVRIAP